MQRASSRDEPNTSHPPDTYDDLTNEMALQFDALSKRLQQIATFAMSHPNDMAMETIAVISKRAGVQPSSLIRFAKAFGYAGFTELQKVFQQRLKLERPSYHDRLQALEKEMQGARGKSTPYGFLQRFVSANITALEHLSEEIRPQDLEKAVAMMDNAGVIHLMAQRRAFPVASYLYYLLTKLGRPCHLIDSLGGMASEQQSLIQKGDLLLAISFADYSSPVIEAAARAASNKVPVLAITDRRLSPLGRHAALSLLVEDEAVHDFRSLGATFCLVQALALGLGARHKSNVTRKSDKQKHLSQT